MHVKLRRTGGFAGISTNAEVDSDRLPPERAGELESLVGSLTAPDQQPSPHARDAQRYELTIDGRTLVADDTNLPEEWEAAIEWLLEHGS